MNHPSQASHAADLASLAGSTREDGTVDLTVFEARRLILRHQTVDGTDVAAIAVELAGHPLNRTEEGAEQIHPLLDVIRSGLTDRERARFDGALDALNVGESDGERFLEAYVLEPAARAGAAIARIPADLHERIGDQLVAANRWAEKVRDSPDNPYWQRAMGGAVSELAEDTQRTYGRVTGAARQGMNMLGEVVDLVQFGARFAADPHFRDMIVGAGLLYAEEVARDPARVVRDVEKAADTALAQWTRDYAQAQREGREAQFLGETEGAVGVELLAAVLPPLKLAKLGKLARAVDGVDGDSPSPPDAPGSGGVLDELLELTQQRQRRDGVEGAQEVHDPKADLFFNGLAGVRRSQGELQDLVDELRAAGHLDGLLRSGALTPRELGFLARRDITLFDGEVSFEQSVNAWARQHAADGLTRQQTGDIAEALVAHQMVRDGYRDLTPIQNNSGHGNDLMGFNPATGRWEVVEVKGSSVGNPASPSGDPDSLVLKRLERAVEARGHWDPANMWEADASRVARRILDDAVNPETGRIDIGAKWARVSIAQEADGSLTFPSRIELEPWRKSQARAPEIDTFAGPLPAGTQGALATSTREPDALREFQRSAPAREGPAPSLPPGADLRDARHLGHAQFQQAVDAIERSPNIPSGAFTGERLHQAAANLLYTSLAGGERPQGGQNERLDRIEFAVLNTQRDGLIAVQGELGSPAAKLAYLPAAQDNATSLAQASQQVHDTLAARREQMQGLEQPAPAQALEDSARKSPGLG